MLCFFFFKQKSAYEMRISDWSDVCSSDLSTFAAAFPMDNPRYIVLVMIDEPKGNAYSSGQRTAGWTAAPVVRKVVTRAGQMLGVFHDESRAVDVSELLPLLRRGEEANRCGSQPLCKLRRWRGHGSMPG